MTAEPRDRRATNILLTGSPGVGKTTVIMGVAVRLRAMDLAGFYTEEMRKRGQREGFRAVTFSGKSTVLAHVSFKGPHRVGRYRVDLRAFDRLVGPELTRAADIILIDEIGKMECFSAAFISAVRRIFDGDLPAVATVAVSGGGFIAEVKARPDAEILQVTRENRDGMPTRVAEMVMRSVNG
jgi:nucleoside-triphosphatase